MNGFLEYMLSLFLVILVGILAVSFSSAIYKKKDTLKGVVIL